MNVLELLTLLQILFQFSSTRCPPSKTSRRYVSTALPLVHRNAERAGAGDPARHRNWHLVNSRRCGSALTDRIVGGSDAALGQFPWMARVGYVPAGSVLARGEDPAAANRTRPVFRCGGTLINERYVLTAAHCVINLPGTLIVGSIRLGEYNVRTDTDCVEDECADPVVDVIPEQILVHKDYDVPENQNDIALIRLSETVKFSKWIMPICLPFGSLMTKNLTNEQTEVAGWGFYDISIPTGSDVLQTVHIPVINNQKCKHAFRRRKLSGHKQLCVGGEVGKDSCNGDSGGPLMKVEAVAGPPRTYILGIVSFGAKYCGLTAAPAIYTRVTHYMPWILDNIRGM